MTDFWLQRENWLISDTTSMALPRRSLSRDGLSTQMPARTFIVPLSRISAKNASMPAIAAKPFGLYDFAAKETYAMALFALEAGLTLPTETVRTLAAACDVQTGSEREALPPFESIISAHATLSALIAPMTPRTVLLMHVERERLPLLSSFGPLPIMRRMTFLAAAALVGLLGSSLSSQINTANMQRDMIENSGLSLLVVELFLVCAALLGTTFANLFQLSRALLDGSYDDRHDAIYWLNIVVGVISGIILSQFVFHVVQAEGGPTAGSIFLSQPLLALLGGFSGGVVHKILSRIILAVESIFGAHLPNSMTDLQSKRNMIASVKRSELDLPASPPNVKIGLAPHRRE